MFGVLISITDNDKKSNKGDIPKAAGWNVCPGSTLHVVMFLKTTVLHGLVLLFEVIKMNVYIPTIILSVVGLVLTAPPPVVGQGILAIMTTWVYEFFAGESIWQTMWNNLVQSRIYFLG